jgi:peptide deformylase
MNNSHDHLIRKGDDPILKQVCTPIEPGEPLPFLELMERACRRASNGVGLAAPQVGHARRVIFTLSRNGMGDLGQFFINPVIIWRSKETDVAEEGCLSYPGITKRIRRFSEIRLAFLDRARRPHEVLFRGFPARVIQHEVDHLDGICRVGDPSFVGEPDRAYRARYRGPSPLRAAFPLLAAAAAIGTGGRR